MIHELPDCPINWIKWSRGKFWLSHKTQQCHHSSYDAHASEMPAGVRQSNGKKILCKLRLGEQQNHSTKNSDRHSNEPIVDELRVRRARDFDHISMWNCARCCCSDKCFEQRVFVLKIENSVRIFANVFRFAIVLRNLFSFHRDVSAPHVNVRSAADFRRV